MPERIPHSRPVLPTAEEWAQVTAKLTPGWAADGPCVERFAAEAAQWLGGVSGVAVNSGTSALHLALLALGVTPGSEVLVPAYCCAALLNAVALAGAIPVLVDCEADGFNLSPDDARRRVTRRTAAVVVAHMFGQPAPLEPFLDLGFPVIEDCAQSLGAAIGGRPTGSRGAAAITSFYATKVITTGQGGLVSTADPSLVACLKDLVEYDNREDWRPRFNYNMGELQAALGLWQLERLPAFLTRRRAIAAYYHEQLNTYSSFTSAPVVVGRGAPGVTDGCSAQTQASPVFFRYVIRVPSSDAVFRTLQAAGIDAKRPVYRPLHHYLGGEYPLAQAAHEQIVSIPIHPLLSDAQVERVASEVRRSVSL